MRNHLKKHRRLYSILCILMVGSIVLSVFQPRIVLNVEATTTPSQTPTITPKLTITPSLSPSQTPTITATVSPDVAFVNELIGRRPIGRVDLSTDEQYAAYFDSLGDGNNISHNAADVVRCKNDEQVAIIIPGDWTVTWAPESFSLISRCPDNVSGYKTLDLGQHPNLAAYPWILAITERSNSIPNGREMLMSWSVQSIGWRTEDGITIADNADAEVYVLCGKYSRTDGNNPITDFFMVRVFTAQSIRDANGGFNIDADSVNMAVWTIEDGNAEDVNTALQQCHQDMPDLMKDHVKQIVVIDEVGPYWGNLAFLHPSK